MRNKIIFHSTRLLAIAALALCPMFFVPEVMANDFLEHKEHYLAYSAGQDKVHFKIPIFSRGGYNYYSTDVDGHTPYLFYKLNGTQYEFCVFGAGRHEPNNDDDDPRGLAWVQALDGGGVVEVTNIYNGGRNVVPADGEGHSYYVKKEREAGNDDDYVTWLEVDWYPPLELAGDTFHVGVNASFCRAYDRSWTYHFVWILAEDIRGDSTIMQPQLSDPYFYAVNESGITGYGMAAIPYMIFNDPKEYNTSLDSMWCRTSDRSGSLYVMTNDTVQKNFCATFNVYKTKDPDIMMPLTSNNVDIPPYHRIYNLKATEEKDSTDTYTGNNVLQWEIRNPLLHDLVESDYFEVQRAFKNDYSDAQQVDIVSMKRDSFGVYTFLDDSRDTWTGRAQLDSNSIYLQVSDEHFLLEDEEGQTLADLNVKLINEQVKHPALPVFYRVRRASSSIWGWIEGFSQKTQMSKHNYLAPLDKNQPDYTKDPEYDKNRKIHFAIHLNNEEVPVPELKKEDCRLEYQINKYVRSDSVELTVSYFSVDNSNKAEDVALIQITDPDGRMIVPWSNVPAGTYKYLIGSKISVKSNKDQVPALKPSYTFELSGTSALMCKVENDVLSGSVLDVAFERTGLDINSSIDDYRDFIIDSLFTVMKNGQDTVPGRCMWDRTARLVLMRTIVETKNTTEFIIPQDSIIRQSDGSWIAHYTDVANHACSNYRYAVRIDQSDADLHVLDSVSLMPKVINGPDLYFDDAAKIASFTATQGAAVGQQKRGVLLNWIPSSTAVDEYVLTRLMKGSDHSADTIYVGVDNNFFDETALPSVVYEYTVTAKYECNGKSSSNSATAEGWRTNLGEISGSILMPDNSGMVGVEVALQDSAGNIVGKQMTGSDGAYMFDSLEYYHPADDVIVNFVREGAEGGIDPDTCLLFMITGEDGHIIEPFSTRLKGNVKVPRNARVHAKTYAKEIYNKETSIIAIASQSGTFTGRFTFEKKQEYDDPVQVLSADYAVDPDATDLVTSTEYIVIPTHKYAQFSFNHTSAGSAAIKLSPDNAVAGDINFENISTVRLTGRALYENSTIPVAGAMFLLNGDTVLRGSTPLKTGTDGNFVMEVTKGQPYTLQIFKPGHTFAQDGYFQMEEGKDTFAIDKPLDGIRFYDQTKVRLVGRVAGGIDQRDLPEAFGLGKNNLGDNLQLVLQLEGDNVAHFVHDPENQNRDTVQQFVNHIVYTSDPLEPTRVVGQTSTLFEKKRIIIHPDSLTGEYEVDLFPVKYKVLQATATGYATLFASGAGLETFDLTNAPLVNYDPVIGSDSVHYNAVYDRIYRSPVQVHLTQLMYGIEQDGYGEQSMEVSGFNPNEKEKIKLFTTQMDGTVTYALGYPVFLCNRKYQFEASAYEDYYYNNTPDGTLDRVQQRSGMVTIHNGMHNSTESETYELDSVGKNRNIWLTVDLIRTQTYGEDALCTVSVALEEEGNTVETDAFKAFVAGDVVLANELTTADADIVLLDIVRDPGGNGSSAWIESGTTYNFAYTESYETKVGLEFTLKYGLNVSNDIGTVAAPNGAGSYLGSNFTTSKQLSIPIPITHEWKWGNQYSYSVTTNERISTSSGHIAQFIGSNADVFVGAMHSQVCGKAKSIGIINDSLFQARQPAIQAGTMHVLAQGTDTKGDPYYLVTGEKVVLGSTINNTFVYSQYYILENVIPQLAMQRDNLLMTFPDEKAAQAAADAADDVVYWYIDSLTAITLNDTLPAGSYQMVLPSKSTKAYPNRIAAIDRMIAQWLTILVQNEEEKVLARQSGQYVGTWSVSYGNSVSHSDSYTATANYNELPQGMALIGTDALSALYDADENLLWTALNNFKEFYGELGGGADRFGKSLTKALEELKYDAKDKASGQAHEKTKEEMGTVTNSSKFTCEFNPVFDFSADSRITYEKTEHKQAGFTIEPDYQGDITVSVYRANMDEVWKSHTSGIRSSVDAGDSDNVLYGSYVYYTQAGSTYCSHEEEEKTQFYNKGTLINNATMMLAVPEMSIDRYEVSNVLSNQRAVFHLELKNEGQVQYGMANTGTNFALSLLPETNPHGAKVYVNGAPLSRAVEYYLTPGQSVSQVLEVERGEVDDYENLGLYFNVGDCPKTYSTLNFSVHFTPESSPVTIESPRQNWTMNTLSPHDSVGYYLPIDISGFNIHHKNFDHIEFQYKLSTQSDDNWVNQCSFYANDSLYALVSGNKAMIENGRIVPFRFYGERDPIEQRYDLRAVSFCRYGSGFVTQASPVISGIKDTRPPRVFGEPEPANSILGVGDNLLLRFNEAIAGNYLDEDNNFQITGITNETGLSAGTSLHFDGNGSAYTKVKRDLTDKSFTIDMMIRPTQVNNRANDMVLFETGNSEASRQLLLTTDNRLRLLKTVGNVTLGKSSKPLGDILSFVRVLCVYDKETGRTTFYAGTDEITDRLLGDAVDAPLEKESSAYFRFGSTYDGDMLETRVWTKALTLEEITATANHSLTGYERELLAYYRMDEGKGGTVSDLAHGATLYLEGCSWNKQEGFSLRLNGDTVQLDGNLLGRSAIYDETLMFWFKAESNGTLFSAGRSEASGKVPAKGTRIALEKGKLVLHSGANDKIVNRPIVNNEWHHFVLTVNRAYNNAALFVDGQMYQSFDAVQLEGIVGDMYLGGDGFKGNIDEFVIFEQALPKSLVEVYEDIALTGDEMGLVGYLPFEEQFLNESGVLEQRFSGIDKRIIRDPSTGEVIDNDTPLIIGEAQSTKDNAPVKSHGLLNKLYFDWSFNNDELMINLLNRSYEINKQSVYVTVREVEDLNGNPMVSPVTWTAFVDRNSLKWSEKSIQQNIEYNAETATVNYQLSIINHSGKRHTYTIESLPSWLTVDNTYGAIEPMAEQNVRLTFNGQLAVGEYSDIIYLTDEDGLSEPLQITYTIEAVPPYDEPDEAKYPFNMSVCAQVKIGGAYDTDSRDIVYAFYRNECVGMDHVAFDNITNKSNVYMTVYGDETMNRKQIRFQLWQASTGKLYDLSSDKDVLFSSGAVYGCGNGEPVMLTANGWERQTLTLKPGWNWSSFYLNLQPYNAKLSTILTANEPWTEGDIIKNPATRHFVVYSDSLDNFVGQFKYLRYVYTYMIYCQTGNTMYVYGDTLPEDSMFIRVSGGGQWNALPCLYNEVTPLTQALAGYYEDATPGDIIKARNRFATFTEDKRWEGNLTALRPGEGYFLRRMAPGTVSIPFIKQSNSAAIQQRHTPSLEEREGERLFSNPNAATNMTIIARLENEKMGKCENEKIVNVYVGSELVGQATPYTVHHTPSTNDEVYYFLTIQSDKTGELRFEMDGKPLTIVNDEQLDNQSSIVNRPIVNYVADSHAGTIANPVILRPAEESDVEKRFINGILYIYRDGKVYNAQGAEVR